MSVTSKAMKPVIAILLSLAYCTATAIAQDNLEVNTVVQKEILVELDDGTTETDLVTADTVLPGERVVYTITYKNVGAAPAENVIITNPIADTLTYVAGSAKGDGARIEFSIDGGQSFDTAQSLRIDDNGVVRPATTKDYTHVRWVMQTTLAAGGEGQASFAADLE